MSAEAGSSSGAKEEMDAAAESPDSGISSRRNSTPTPDLHKGWRATEGKGISGNIQELISRNLQEMTLRETTAGVGMETGRSREPPSQSTPGVVASVGESEMGKTVVGSGCDGTSWWTAPEPEDEGEEMSTVELISTTPPPSPSKKDEKFEETLDTDVAEKKKALNEIFSHLRTCPVCKVPVHEDIMKEHRDTCNGKRKFRLHQTEKFEQEHEETLAKWRSTPNPRGAEVQGWKPVRDLQGNLIDPLVEVVQAKEESDARRTGWPISTSAMREQGDGAGDPNPWQDFNYDRDVVQPLMEKSRKEVMEMEGNQSEDWEKEANMRSSATQKSLEEREEEELRLAIKHSLYDIETEWEGVLRKEAESMQDENYVMIPCECCGALISEKDYLNHVIGCVPK